MCDTFVGYDDDLVSFIGEPFHCKNFSVKDFVNVLAKIDF